MGIIFDLDQTLVDSSIAMAWRDKRNWKRVYDLIPKFDVYPGINQLLSWIDKNQIPTCLVTSAPRPYCARVVTRFGWRFDHMVCYHDTSLHKPHPAPIIEAIEKLELESSAATLSIGDQARDIIASNKAGVKILAAIWGTNERQALLNANPDYVCQSVKELTMSIRKELPGHRSQSL